MLKWKGTVACLLIALLCLAAAFASCNKGDQDNGAQTSASTASQDNSAAPVQQADTTPKTEAKPVSEAGEGTESAPAGDETAEENDEAQVASSFVTGDDVYKAANCAMCHGKQLEGSHLAPALAGLKEHWTEDTMEQYLTDPQGYTETDERLKANHGRYKLPMPAWEKTGLGDEDMKLLVKWLLEEM